MDMRKLSNILAHVCVVLGASLLVLWVINLFNPKMQFLSGGATNVLLIVLCVCSLLLGVVTIGFYHSYRAYQFERATAAARARRMRGTPVPPPHKRP